ncbi:MAG: aminotransferase class I/II-fold pyridoxal phosphate-dependent enzyme [Bacteroidota bacterium]
MFPIQKIPSRTVLTHQGEYLWFGGTSYLGIPYNANFQQLIKVGLEQYGSNWGSSRNNTLQLEIYNAVENFLSEFVKAPSAVTVSSGMLAGQMVINFLQNQYPKGLFIHAPKVHPALWTADYQANGSSFKDFINTINDQISQTKAEVVTILADSVSSPHFENYNFDWVQNLTANRIINLVIDDSHSLGVMNENGKGVYSSVSHNANVNIIVVASLNKALGVPGGVIFGDSQLIKSIKQSAFFSACSPIAPAYTYACASAANIYQSALQVLRKNIAYFNKNLNAIIGLGNLKGHPAYCFDSEGLPAYLLSKNILVPSFGYPNPTDKAVTRLVISSLHNFNDLDLLIDSLNKFHHK